VAQRGRQAVVVEFAGVVKAQRTADNTQFMVAGQRPAITTDSHEAVQAVWISFRSGVDATDPLAHTDCSC
jgi:hypothetical protein